MSATGPKRTLLVTDPSALVHAPLCGLILEQSFPASRFAFPVLGDQLP